MYKVKKVSVSFTTKRKFVSLRKVFLSFLYEDFIKLNLISTKFFFARKYFLLQEKSYSEIILLHQFNCRKDKKIVHT